MKKINQESKVYRIYIVTNSINGKQYIGITNNLQKRWNSHKNANGKIPALHKAIKKYGIDLFVFSHIADAFDFECAKTIERLLIFEHNTIAPNGYNLTSGGDGTFNPSNELREKLSLSHQGKIQSEETRKKRSNTLKMLYAQGMKVPSKGKTWKMSEETKEKIRASKIGKNNPMYGKKQSPEIIAKRVAAHAIAIAKRKAVEA